MVILGAHEKEDFGLRGFEGSSGYIVVGSRGLAILRSRRVMRSLPTPPCLSQTVLHFDAALNWAFLTFAHATNVQARPAKPRIRAFR